MGYLKPWLILLAKAVFYFFYLFILTGKAVLTMILTLVGYYRRHFPTKQDQSKRKETPLPGRPPVRVAVIGGGIAGCGAAWSLSKAGYQVEIFERRHALGGNAKTVDWEVSLDFDGKTKSCLHNGAPSANASSSSSESIEIEEKKSQGRPLSSSISSPTRPSSSSTSSSTALVRTGLSVLAWPPTYFRNYRRLLVELGITAQTVELPFLLQSPKGEHWTHDETSASLRVKYRNDIASWVELVEMVRSVSDWVHGTNGVPTLYASSVLNPFNYIPIRALMWWYGISREFWVDVFVPVYSSSFLTANLSLLPSVIAPIIDDIIPLARPPVLDTWDSNSSVVFDRMAEKVHAVRTSVEILEIDIHNNNSNTLSSSSSSTSSSTTSSSSTTTTTTNTSTSKPIKIVYGPAIPPSSSPLYSSSTSSSSSVSLQPHQSPLPKEALASLRQQTNPTGLDPSIDESRRSNATAHASTAYFDHIVFACPCDSALNMIKTPTLLQRLLLSAFSWTDDDDDHTFTEGIIHSDSSVIPETVRTQVLHKYSNYIETTPAISSPSPSPTRPPSPLSERSIITMRSYIATLVHSIQYYSTSFISRLFSKNHALIISARLSRLLNFFGEAVSISFVGIVFLICLMIDIITFTLTILLPPLKRVLLSLLPTSLIPTISTSMCGRLSSFLSPFLPLCTSDYRFENTFVVSTWIPAVHAVYADLAQAEDANTNVAVDGSRVSVPVPRMETRRPMLISYNLSEEKRRRLNPRLIHHVSRVTNVRAHPHLSLRNLILGQLTALLQGADNCYYCSSWCTPGTGHDLSLLSGFAVASAIGAPYPFSVHSGPTLSTPPSLSTSSTSTSSPKLKSKAENLNSITTTTTTTTAPSATPSSIPSGSTIPLSTSGKPDVAHGVNPTEAVRDFELLRSLMGV